MVYKCLGGDSRLDSSALSIFGQVNRHHHWQNDEAGPKKGLAPCRCIKDAYLHLRTWVLANEYVSRRDPLGTIDG
jgi:hypothetical protein